MPLRALSAYLEEDDHARAWRIYMAEQLWALNAAWRERYDYPHYIDMIDGKSDAEQRAQDERERQAVYDWLMGGDTT